MLGTSDLRFFLAIATAPSLAAAARALDVTPPAVSQRLASLEERLALKLVERGGGSLILTSEGEMLARRAALILGDLEDLSEDLAQRRGAVTGPLRVVAPFGFGRIHVAPLMARFIEAHPEVVLSLSLTDDPRSAARTDQWDVLVHVGRLPDLDVVQRKLAMNRRLLCASPAYVGRHGLPQTPDDLRQHRCGVVREDQADVTLRALATPGSKRVSIRVEPAFASNDGEVVRQWALDGLGIVERSEWSVAADLRTGRLVEVLPGWKLADADVVALLNPRTLRAARTQAFVEHMAKALAPPPWLDR